MMWQRYLDFVGLADDRVARLTGAVHFGLGDCELLLQGVVATVEFDELHLPGVHLLEHLFLALLLGAFD